MVCADVSGLGVWHGIAPLAAGPHRGRGEERGRSDLARPQPQRRLVLHARLDQRRRLGHRDAGAGPAGGAELGFSGPPRHDRGRGPYIDKCKTPEGGICYSLGNTFGGPRLPITAAAVATLYNAGEYDAPIAQRCLEYVAQQFRLHDGYSKGAGHDFYTHLYASQAFYMSGDKYWDEYFPGHARSIGQVAKQGRRLVGGGRHRPGLRHRDRPDRARAALQISAGFSTLNEGRVLAMEQALPIAADDVDLSNLARVKEAHDRLRTQLARIVVGQDEVIDQLMIAIFARGHCILEGVPGLAKTLMVSTLADCLSLAIQSHPVHARPDAQRHHGHRSAARRPGDRHAVAALRPRPGLCQYPAGRRNQPHAPQDAGGAVGSDAGAASLVERHSGIPCPIRSSCWPRKTRSSRKGRIPCPRRSSIAFCSRSSSAILRPTTSGKSIAAPPARR